MAIVPSRTPSPPRQPNPLTSATRYLLPRPRTLLYLAAPLLLAASVSSILRYQLSTAPPPLASLVTTHRLFSSASTPPSFPTTPAQDMPFPKEGAEKSKKVENYGGRTYTQKEENEFGRLGTRMDEFHRELLVVS